VYKPMFNLKINACSFSKIFLSHIDKTIPLALMIFGYRAIQGCMQSLLINSNI